MAKLSFLNNFYKLVQQNRLEFFCILETSISSNFFSKLQQRMGNQWKFFSNPSEGLLGGIIVVRRKDLHQVNFYNNNCQAAFRMIMVDEVKSWIFGIIYASTCFYRRRKV